MANLTVDAPGLRIVMQFEGLKLKAYRDVAGHWTIGYGHFGPEVHDGMQIAEQQAKQLLIADLHAAVAVVNRLVRVPVNQNQFDALVDFAYNAGVGAFATSHLLRELNAGQYESAAQQFVLWCHAGGVVVPGLMRRRQAEAELFRRAA